MDIDLLHGKMEDTACILNDTATEIFDYLEKYELQSQHLEEVFTCLDKLLTEYFDRDNLDVNEELTFLNSAYYNYLRISKS